MKRLSQTICKGTFNHFAAKNAVSDMANIVKMLLVEELLGVVAELFMRR